MVVDETNETLTSEEYERRQEEIETARQQKQMLRKQRLKAVALIVAVGIILMLVSGYISYQRALHAPPPLQAGSGVPIFQFLLLGTDAGVDEEVRSDTIMFISVNPDTGHVGLLSIPRDTRVFFSDLDRHGRINVAYALGGPDLALQSVAGLIDHPVHYYVKLDLDGFRRLIDAIGGVPLHVERRMDYQDQAQGLVIDLEPGWQVLNGEQAMQYVRYRDGLGDVSLVDPTYQLYDGRVARQQQFVLAVIEQLLQPRNLMRAPYLVFLAWRSVETNLPIDQVLQLAFASASFELQQVVSQIVPGQGGTVGGAAYWLADTSSLAASVAAVVDHASLPVRIEVLNGSGRVGAAAQLADALRKQGYQVLNVGNADHFNYPQTQVLCVDESVFAQAQALAGEIGGEAVLVDALSRPVQIQVIIGRNFGTEDRSVGF